MHFLATLADILTFGLSWPLTQWLDYQSIYRKPDFPKDCDVCRRLEELQKHRLFDSGDDPVVLAWKERQELSARQLH